MAGFGVTREGEAGVGVDLEGGVGGVKVGAGALERVAVLAVLQVVGQSAVDTVLQSERLWVGRRDADS